MNIKPSVIVFGLIMLLMFWGYWGDYSYAIANFFIGEATKEQVEKAGTWGDSFGAFNALISTIGFITVLATLLLQARSIKDQANDLHRQRFEATFFELLRVMRGLREEVLFQHSKDYVASRKEKKGTSSLVPITTGIKRKGIDAISHANQEFVHWLIKLGRANNPTIEDMINTYMRRIHSTYEATLAPYFRIIYTILYRIKTDPIIPEADKRYYANLLRSQMTTFEITLMGINALAPVAKDFSELVTHFRMLKYLPDNLCEGDWRDFTNPKLSRPATDHVQL
ncbi:putative phage abortive infection protein [Sphingobium sp. AN641]|uniref:putative phage abortive infection protein n=1 Tax=Sphingobium sp. AN641 TaxID=3133443 RepID=UPI0030C06E68